MDRLVWIDIETTGLDATTDHILEIGCVITDADLRPLASRAVLVWPDDPRWTMEVLQKRPAELGLRPEILEMHEASGLLRDLRQRASYALSGAALDVGGFVEEHAPGATSPLCGSSVHFDRGFLVAKRCHALLSTLHYRNLDVSVLKNLARLWGYPAWDAPEKKAHRALDDLACSIAELDHYRATMFRGACAVYGTPCAEHGFIHGQEAEELREGIERLIAAGDPSADDLVALLDNVDARDSLAFLEVRDGDRQPREPSMADDRAVSMSIAIDIRATGDGRVELRLRRGGDEIGVSLSIEEAASISARIDVAAGAAKASERSFAEASRR